MRFDTEDASFRQTAEAWLQSLGDGILADLTAVFATSPGYYPTTLYELWRNEMDRRSLEVATPLASRLAGSPPLPVAHPLDYDWRFTTETAEHLLRQVAAVLEPDDRLAHLGTPSTFLMGIQNFARFRHVLLERNAAMTNAVAAQLADAGEIICLDLTEASERLNAAGAILDPPWYVADTLTFLRAAGRLCRMGAHLWLCQPTLATRPGVHGERVTIERELPTFGLVLDGVAAGAVRYQMPHFESMSLQHSTDDFAAPATWRVGDLWTLRKVSDPPSATAVAVTYTAQAWREVAFGPVRIKLRASHRGDDLGELVPGGVLTTVSRRDPIRKRIGFWTSGNRVYGLRDPERIGRLIQLCENDRIETAFTLARTLQHAGYLGVEQFVAQKLFDILLIEWQEHNSGGISREAL